MVETICRYCGRKISTDTTFCWYCGRELVAHPERPDPESKGGGRIWFWVIPGLVLVVFLLVLCFLR